ncbi:MAG: phosphatase PAP2 family protein [Putridiphycobacter sp.]
MFNKIEEIDQELLLKINHWNSPFFDELMWQISHQWIWIPLYVFILFYAFKQLERKPFLWFILGIGVCFLLADRISVMAFKNVFLRYRPTHNLQIGTLIHTYTRPNGESYLGGQYGFVSSHAANFFALSTYLVLWFKSYSKFWFILFFWAALIGYSRMYLGVHYPLDVLVGGLLGIGIGVLVYYLIRKFAVKK